MSDGPHKSLPMPSRWKRFAECIYNEAYGPEQARDALLAALTKDWHQASLKGCVSKIRIVLSDGQTDFFCNPILQKLELLQEETYGCPLRGVFLDFVAQAVEESFSGGDALREAACQVLQDEAAHSGRQVEEHYLRAPLRNRIGNVRQRTEDAIERLDMVDLARCLLGMDKNEHQRIAAKQTGLDDGVLL